MSDRNLKYCENLTSYFRRKTTEVKVGSVGIGGGNPIRVQSMTTVDTMDTMGSVEQSIRMIEAGSELVRITAPSIKEAQNLSLIKEELRARGFDTPLVADIHFTPNAAELAARIVEKVRVNPGNYADKKKFEEISYDDISYEKELDRIREKFTPLVGICKEYGTAMRIGTNHGSLSDRIMSRYGDTPLGMVESALEFIRICEDLNYYDLVISMKSSNPQVMVQAYRLLVAKLDEHQLKPYPLHLGVTEAGEAEDGRIKSALGIGTLLADGLGDTIRVSLTEEPEEEIPVAKLLVDRIDTAKASPDVSDYPIDPFEYRRRDTIEVMNIGGSNVPRVISDYGDTSLTDKKQLKSVGHSYLPELDKWGMNDTGSDFIYSGTSGSSFMLPNGLGEIIDFESWKDQKDKTKYPLFDINQLSNRQYHSDLNFLRLDVTELTNDVINFLNEQPKFVIILCSDEKNPLSSFRASFVRLINSGNRNPVIVEYTTDVNSQDQYIVDASVEVGGLLIDGLSDGVFLRSLKANEKSLANGTAFGILQAARTRITKTEYISCPSCGRTLFDLQETTAMIRKKTDHLKGVKIGIMGCIVNGPGEMADADFGYVGSGKGKITLYRGKEVVKRGVPSEDALDQLIDLIKTEGMWVDPNQEPTLV